MKAFLIAKVLLFITIGVFGQNQYDFEYKVDSKAFNKERKYFVHVPERYYNNETDSFGVIYLLDAQGTSFYNNGKSIIDYLNWSYQIIPTIVVGIYSDDRGPEFIPKNRAMADDDPDNNGTAHLLQEHIRTEIFPEVAKNFRVNKFKALIGHSRGGAFIASTLFSDNRDMFNAYIAISPGMHYLDRQMLKDAERMIRNGEDFNKFYYCTHGTVGSLEKYFKPQVDFIDSLLQVHPNESLVFGKKQIDGASHWGCVAPSIVNGLLTMSQAYQPDQELIDLFAQNENVGIAEQVKTYYETQNRALKYTLPLDPGSLAYYGNQHSEYGNYKKAIEIFDMVIELAPNSIKTRNSQAWAYREINDNNSALKIYEKANSILAGTSHGMEENELQRWKKIINDAINEIK